MFSEKKLNLFWKQFWKHNQLDKNYLIELF